MNAAEIHSRYAPREADQPRHRLDIAGEECAAARVALVHGQLLRGAFDGIEVHVHLGRHPHAIELLLPLAARHFVIHEDDEREVKRLSPSHDDLTVNEPVVDAKELNGHSARPP
jgi:hypothetical protein